MTRDFRSGLFAIAPGQPIAIVDSDVPDSEVRDGGWAEEDESFARAIGVFMRAYLGAGEALLQGNLSDVADIAPAHLRGPTRFVVFVCADGVLVRYERATESGRDAVGITAASIREVALGLSEQVLVHISEESNALEPGAGGPTITLSARDPATGTKSTLAEIRVQFGFKGSASVSADSSEAGKPPRRVSVESEFDFSLYGTIGDASEADSTEQSFLANMRLTLPVGWQRIEVYARGDVEDWDLQQAHAFAERDILGYVMRRQLRASSLRTLDPNVDARRDWARLFDEYSALLDSNPPEEDIQRFLKRNPILLSPTHIKFWPKLALGATVTDFVFKEADGQYLLVELEPSTFDLFRKDGNTTAKLNHATGQVMDWKRYVADNLSTVRRELDLDGIRSNPKGLVVIGRLGSLSEQNRAKLATLNDEQHRLRIATYDDVLSNAKAAIENILGPLWAASGTADVYMLKPS